MNKTLLGLLSVATLSTSVLAQENTNNNEKTWEERQREAIYKQMEERQEAFKNGAPSEQELATLIERQRNVILALEKERQARTRDQ